MVTPRWCACPGCGVHLLVSDAYPDARYNASPACQQLYGQLTAYTLMQERGEFIHQLAVDAYAAQHVRENAPPIGVAFALIGLYLTCERGSTGRQVQHMHRLLAQRSKTWPRFVPPAHVGAVTVRDVVQASPGDERDAMVRHWCQTVWTAWSAEHERVRELVARVMASRVRALRVPA